MKPDQQTYLNKQNSKEKKKPLANAEYLESKDKQQTPATRSLEPPKLQFKSNNKPGTAGGGDIEEEQKKKNPNSSGASGGTAGATPPNNNAGQSAVGSTPSNNTPSKPKSPFKNKQQKNKKSTKKQFKLNFDDRLQERMFHKAFAVPGSQSAKTKVERKNYELPTRKRDLEAENLSRLMETQPLAFEILNQNKFTREIFGKALGNGTSLEQLISEQYQLPENQKERPRIQIDGLKGEKAKGNGQETIDPSLDALNHELGLSEEVQEYNNPFKQFEAFNPVSKAQTEEATKEEDAIKDDQSHTIEDTESILKETDELVTENDTLVENAEIEQQLDLEGEGEQAAKEEETDPTQMPEGPIEEENGLSEKLQEQSVNADGETEALYYPGVFDELAAGYHLLIADSVEFEKQEIDVESLPIQDEDEKRRVKNDLDHKANEDKKEGDRRVNRLMFNSTDKAKAVSEKAKEIPGEIESARAQGEGIISSAAGEQKGAISGAFAGFRASIQEQQGGIIGQIESQHQSTVAAIEGTYASNRATVEAEYGASVAAINAALAATMAAVEAIYNAAAAEMRAMGADFAAQAQAIASQAAANFRAEVSDDAEPDANAKSEAKAQAAEQTGQAMAQSMIEQANSAADALMQSKAVALQEAQGVAAAQLAALEAQYSSALQGLEAAKQSAIQQADAAKTSNIEAVNQAADGAMQSLEAQEAGQIEAIDKMSSQSIAQLAEMAADATQNLQNAAVETLERFRDDLIHVREMTDDAPAPAREELDDRVKPLEEKLNASIENIKKIVVDGVAQTKQSILDSASKSAAQLANIAAQAIAGGQEAVSSFASSVQEILSAAQQAFSQAQSSHEQESSTITSQAVSGFQQTVATAQQQLQAIEARSQAEAAAAVSSLQGSLSSMLSSLAGMIASNANAAAAAVPSSSAREGGSGEELVNADQRRQEAEDRLLNSDENQREKLINPDTGGAYTDAEMAEALTNAEQRKSDQVAAGEDRLLNADENLREKLINPETGGAYTDAEMKTAIQNAENRKLKDIRIAEDRLIAADENTQEKLINPETGSTYTDKQIAEITERRQLENAAADGMLTTEQHEAELAATTGEETVSEIQLSAGSILEEQAMLNQNGEILSDAELGDLIVEEVVGNISENNATYLDLETDDLRGDNLTETSLLLAGQMENLPPDLQMRVLQEGNEEISFIVENMTTIDNEGFETVYGNLAHIAEVTGVEGAEELANLFVENSKPIQDYIEGIENPKGLLYVSTFEDTTLLGAMNNSASSGNGSLLSFAIAENMYDGGYNVAAQQMIGVTTNGINTARENFLEGSGTHASRMTELSHLVNNLQLGGFGEDAINGAIEVYMQEHSVDFENYEEQSAIFASTLQGSAYAIDTFSGEDQLLIDDRIDQLHTNLYHSTDLINSDAGREHLAQTILQSGYGQRTWMDTARDNSDRYDARAATEAGDSANFINFSEKLDSAVLVGADLGLQSLGSLGDASSVDSFITGLSNQLAYSDPALAEALDSARGDITSTFESFYIDNNPDPLGLVKSIGGVFSKVASNKELNLSEDQKTTLSRFGTALSLGTSVLKFVEDPTVPGGVGISRTLIGVYKKTLETGDFVKGIDIESLTENTKDLSWSQLSRKGKLGVISEGLGAASSIYSAFDNPEFKTIFNAVFDTSQFAAQFAALNGKPGAAKLLGKAGTFITLAFSGFELVKAIRAGDNEAALKAGLPIAGALIGSVIPGVGTALGLAIGSLIAIGIDIFQHIFSKRPDEHYEDNTDEAIMAAVLIESMNAGYDLDDLGLDHTFDVTNLDDINTIMENGPFANLVHRFRDVDKDFNSVWPIIGKITDSTNQPLGNLLVSMSHFEDKQLNFLAKFMLEMDQTTGDGSIVYSSDHINALKGIIDFISPGALPGNHDIAYDEAFLRQQVTSVFHESDHDRVLDTTFTDEMIYAAYYMKYFVGGNSQLQVEDLMALMVWNYNSNYESIDLTNDSDLAFLYHELTYGEVQWDLVRSGNERPKNEQLIPRISLTSQSDANRVEGHPLGMDRSQAFADQPAGLTEENHPLGSDRDLANLNGLDARLLNESGVMGSIADFFNDKVINPIDGTPVLDPTAEFTLRELGMEFYAHQIAYEDIEPQHMGIIERLGGDVDNIQHIDGPYSFQAVFIPGKEGTNDVLAIKGSREGMDWMTNMDGKQVGNEQFERNRAQIEHILTEVATGPVDITGHSLGGSLAQIFAVNYPEQVASLTTFQAPGIADSEVNKYKALDESDKFPVTHHLGRGDVVDLAGDQHVPGTFYKHFLADGVGTSAHSKMLFGTDTFSEMRAEFGFTDEIIGQRNIPVFEGAPPIEKFDRHPQPYLKEVAEILRNVPGYPKDKIQEGVDGGIDLYNGGRSAWNWSGDQLGGAWNWSGDQLGDAWSWGGDQFNSGKDFGNEKLDGLKDAFSFGANFFRETSSLGDIAYGNDPQLGNSTNTDSIPYSLFGDINNKTTTSTGLDVNNPIFDESRMRDALEGSTIQGAGNPVLELAMKTLYTQPEGTDLTNALETVAAVRGIDSGDMERQYNLAMKIRETGRDFSVIQYEKKVNELPANERANYLTKHPHSDISPDLDLLLHPEFTGSSGQLRFGKVLGDVFGIDPVFGSLISPTGGAVGPGNESVSDGDPDNGTVLHGTVHDAAGYLSNAHGIGPGYNYLRRPWELPSSDPFSGQLSGTAYWGDRNTAQQLGATILSAPGNVGEHGFSQDTIVNAGIDAGGDNLATQIVDGDFKGIAIDAYHDVVDHGKNELQESKDTLHDLVDSIIYGWDGPIDWSTSWFG